MPVKVEQEARDDAGDPRSTPAFLNHPGEMGALMRAHAWKNTPLGRPADWPDVLKAFVSMILASSQPMFMAWGDSLTWFYNDAFIPILGRKHGDALGRSGRYVWAEAWSTLQAMFARVFAGESLYMTDLKLQLQRRGTLEDAHFAFSYNPVKDSSGRVVGLFGTCIETTEQVVASRRAREADERLQLALSAGDGVGTWDWDIPNDSVVADERFARWYGVDPEYAAAGAPLGSFLSSIHPEDRDEVQARIVEAMRVGGSYFTEYRITRPDGSLRWVSAQGKCTLGPDGAPLRFPGVTFDITLRKKAELELRHLNQDLERQIAEQTRDRTRTWEVSPEIMGILNRDGYFEKSNPAWGAILGWSEHELRTTPFFDFIHPEDLERTEAAWADAAQGKPALRFENRYRRKEGGWCWLSWVAVPEGDKVYCTARHITADKARAEELQSATLERERLWQSSPDLLIVLDFDGTVLRVNPAWTDILGYETDDLVGRHIADFAAPVDHKMTAEAFKRAAQQPLSMLENRFLHKDGSQRWLSWVSSPAGNHIYGIGRHITAAKEAAAALTRAEEALRQSQKMEAVGQLTGGIAHDFNNLLAGISGSLELIHLRIAQNRLGDLDRYIDAAQSASRRASSLTQRLLAFARRQTLDSRPIDVNKLIAGMEELLRRSVGPMVELQVLAAGGLWTCKLDAAQLENAVLNLCINARDAMAPNGGKLTLETSNKTLDEREAAELGLSRGQYVCICVADTGCGMPPEVITQVFDPFFTTKPLGQGTGLGLSMVYGFMRQSGGQVRVISEVGKGSTLYLYVPRHVGQTVADEHAPALAVDPGAGETVLIIDDEATIRMVASEILRESGYEVIEAQDGPSGLKILESETPIDLLVTDVGLPGGMNGRQVADAARALRPDLKVLFITGYAESAIIGNGLLEDGMSIITKPFEMAMFANKVRELIDTAQRD